MIYISVQLRNTAIRNKRNKERYEEVIKEVKSHLREISSSSIYESRACPKEHLYRNLVDSTWDDKDEIWRAVELNIEKDPNIKVFRRGGNDKFVWQMVN